MTLMFAETRQAWSSRIVKIQPEVWKCERYIEKYL
jgi:hypothetical protein